MKSPKYLVPDGTYMADPAAHVFNGKLFIYPSHDIESGIPENDNGDHFDMRDYHVLSLDSMDGPVTDHGVILDLKDIPWAGRQPFGQCLHLAAGALGEVAAVDVEGDGHRGVGGRRPAGIQLMRDPARGNQSFAREEHDRRARAALRDDLPRAKLPRRGRARRLGGVNPGSVPRRPGR